MASTQTAPRRIGRRRSATADAAILRATLDVLREVGYDGLTISAVIERAAVSSATLYRRWRAKQDLVVAAVTTLVPAVADIDTGCLVCDLDMLIRHVARSVAARDDDVHDALTIAAKRDPTLAAALEAKFVGPRRAALDAILECAVARGELPTRPSADVAHSLVLGPIYHRGLILRLPLTPAFVRAAIGHAVRGLGATDVDVNHQHHDQTRERRARRADLG
jgi:AcrR family transcriptional regulator